MRRMEEMRIRFGKGTPHFRTENAIRDLIAGAGFEITHTEPSAPGKEEIWFVAKPQGNAKQRTTDG